jgi:hypothetical protein
VIVFAIRALNDVDDNTTDEILNILAYRVAVWLSDRGIPSVFIPRGGLGSKRLEKTPHVSPSLFGAQIPGLEGPSALGLVPVAVLTAFE